MKNKKPFFAVKFFSLCALFFPLIFSCSGAAEADEGQPLDYLSGKYFESAFAKDAEGSPQKVDSVKFEMTFEGSEAKIILQTSEGQYSISIEEKQDEGKKIRCEIKNISAQKILSISIAASDAKITFVSMQINGFEFSGGALESILEKTEFSFGGGAASGETEGPQETPIFSSQTESGRIFCEGDAAYVQFSEDGSLKISKTATKKVVRFEDKNASDAIVEMGNGWNLGNTLESGANETAWGQPYTTEEMIAGVANCGFKSVRIPVAWSYSFVDSTNEQSEKYGKYTLKPEILDRVSQVASWVLNYDMYAVVNIHWDGGWWKNFAKRESDCWKHYEALWEQIARYFKDFPEKLIFESANEELGGGEHCLGFSNDNDAYEMTNRINQKFIDIVRKSGGYNDKRIVLIAGYNTDIRATCDSRFRMPTDTIKNRMMLSVHYYTPWDFCGESKRPNWGSNFDHWGSDSDKKEMRRLFEMMQKYWKAGDENACYPIIVGEYGVVASNSETGKLKDGTQDWLSEVVRLSKEMKYCPMLWDCNDWYNRNRQEFNYDWLKEIFY